MEKAELPCGNIGESVGKTEAKDKNCKQIGRVSKLGRHSEMGTGTREYERRRKSASNR